jgi:hypothetical protein
MSKKTVSVSNELVGGEELTVLPSVGLRDYFAGQALAGMLAWEGGGTIDAYARDAYRLADAMMIAREEEE